jgi:hypothetical protein
MTMTPRERADAIGAHWHFLPPRLIREIEAAITEHVRALLADDQETINEMTNWGRRCSVEVARAALAALRRKALGE